MIVLAALIGVVSFLFIRMLIQRRRYPPGPFPLPLIGNLHQFGYKVLVRKLTAVEAIREWANQYGSVYTFWFGPIVTVNICDYATAVDAMVKKGSAFVGRNMPFILTMTRNNRGIVVTNGPHWLEQRRFALHTLRNFGMGRNIIEERIMYEFNIACEELDKCLENGEKSIDPHNFFNLLVGNIINRMLFTNRFEKEDEQRFFVLKKNLDEMAHSFTPFDILITEWNINWPIVRWRMKHLMKPLDAIKEFIQNQINQRRDCIANGSHVPQGEGEDFVDAFLIQMNKDRQSGVETSFDEETLLMTLLDLWSAGQETTLTALYWVFTFLLLNPKVQKRVEEELFSLTSGQRLISLTDKPKTPYFNAVLTEIFRCALMAPLNLLRQSIEDTMVGPYSIPKGTSITAQVSLIGTDEKHFTNPSVFDPDRYFNSDGLEQMVLPFGLGKRACPGSPLANAELYLIVSNLLLRYKISADPDHMPTLIARSEAGNMRQAQPYHICFEQRSS